MYRDTHEVDKFETLCDSPSILMHRYRMKETPDLAVKPGDKESLVVVMKGSVEIKGHGFGPKKLGEMDVCYFPRDEEYAITRKSDFAEVIIAYAPAAKKYVPYVRKFEDIKPIAGGMGSYRRQIYNVITESDPANRFLGGFVKGEDGNWGGFPPHKHDGKPEVYVYFGMGKRFGIQMVLTEEKDSAYVVRDGDAVYFEKGYHPCVATPGAGMNFLWIISAKPEARDLSIDFHPDYKDMPVGSTHLKMEK